MGKPQSVKVKERSQIPKWLFRFFTGALVFSAEPWPHNNSTWFHGATKGTPRNLTWWRKKSRINRAIWNNGSFWATFLLAFGLLKMTGGTLIIAGALLPYIAYRLFIVIRETLFMPYRVAVGDDKEQQAWIMRPKWRKRLNLTRRSKPHPRGMVDPDKRGEPEPEMATGEWTAEVIGIVEDRRG